MEWVLVSPSEALGSGRGLADGLARMLPDDERFELPDHALSRRWPTVVVRFALCPLGTL